MILQDPTRMLLAAARKRGAACIEYPGDFGSKLVLVEGSLAAKISGNPVLVQGDLLNTDNGVIYYRTVRTGGFFKRNQIFLYKDAAKTQLVASASTSGTGLVCTPSGSTGLFGIIGINSNLTTVNSPDQKIHLDPAKSLQGPWTLTNGDLIAIDLGNFQVTGASTKFAWELAAGTGTMWWAVQIGGTLANRLRLHATSFRTTDLRPGGWDLVALSAVMPRPLPAPATIPLLPVAGSGINASFDVETFVGNAASITNTLESPICE